MLPILLKRLLLLFFCLDYCTLQAQSESIANTAYVFIEAISIEGNKKTKSPYILRELEFSIGDSILMSDFGKTLERNRLRLMNRGLYSSVKINVKNWATNNHLSLNIVVRESWYLWPIPVFDLADRNYNVWWNEQNHSLKRANYGVDLYHNNLTGRGDVARIGGQLGYAHKLEADYTLPGIDKKQKFGLDFNVFYRKQKELAYKTEKNKLVFKFNPNDYLLRRFRFILALTFRPALFTLHSLAVERHQNKIAQDVATTVNPDFFLQSVDRQQHWSLVYNVEHDRRDIKPYPLHGWLGNLEIRQNGLLQKDNLHLFRVKGRLEKYFSLSTILSIESIWSARFSMSKKAIPYYNNQGLGYEKDFVRGFEYYVIDGKDFALSKTSLHFQVIKRTFNLGKYMPLPSYKSVPLKVYLSLNNDFGYANDPTYATLNPLNNRLLWGTGLGLDFVAYYSRVVQLEWSRNDLGENGFFIHLKTGI
jgi:outer membrane protein assembly factor BamA